jgi:hypothetical protein
MFTLATLSGKTIVSTNHNRDEMLSLKDGNLVHYTTSAMDGPKKPYLTKVVKGSTSLFKTEYLSMSEIRDWRDIELKESDWRATIDYPGSDQQSWLSYRTELREIPQKYDKVEDILIPIKP